MFKALGKAPRRAFAKNLIRAADPRRRTLLRYAVGVPDEDAGEKAYVPEDYQVWSDAYTRRDMEWIRFHHETLGWPIPSCEEFWEEIIDNTRSEDVKILKYLWNRSKNTSVENFVHWCASTNAGDDIAYQIFSKVLDADVISNFMSEKTLIGIAFKYDAPWLLHWTRKRTRDLTRWNALACHVSGFRTLWMYEFKCHLWIMRNIPYDGTEDRNQEIMTGKGTRYVGIFESMLEALEYAKEYERASIFATLIAFRGWYHGRGDMISEHFCKFARALEPLACAQELGVFHRHQRCNCKR